ncbi:MAG: hypothetical protein KME42_13245 [Tildeniella nuda ZEHNDER 1965/U140]|nr:hypothetical protein [Tildeniella nuda ZEHNDER 1965/U140]
MTVTLLNAPKFCRAQSVYFIGGEGIIRSSHSEAGRWTYLVEMALGAVPDCGRVGAEAMVLLDEVDLWSQDDFKMIVTPVPLVS